jgi:RNA polymerase sigma-70 factor (family 1)
LISNQRTILHNLFKLETITDITLWELAREGNAKAFEELYDRYWHELYTTVYWRVCDEDIAKDIVQDIFITIWHKRDAIHIESSLQGYLKVAAKHKVLNYFKSEGIRVKHQSNAATLQADVTDTTTEILAAKELSVIYQKEIDLLPLKMREVFLLSREDNMSIEQIATNLALSPQTVKNQLTSALKKIRLRLEALRA